MDGTAFVPCLRDDLDRIFAIQTERVVNRDKTVKFKSLLLQIERQSWRGSLAGCRIMIYQHFDDTLTIGCGAQTVGRYPTDGEPFKPMLKQKEQVNQPSLAKQPTGHLIG